MEIIGKKFLINFGVASAILELQSETSLTFEIIEKGGVKDGTKETIAIELTELRPKLYMLTWQEQSGTTVTQIQDHEREVAYNHWTLTTGDFHHQKGTLKPYN